MPIRLFLPALVAVTASVSSALAGPKEDALQVLAKWTDAFAASDVDALVGLYARDALFMGTGSKAVATEPAAIRKYFEGAVLTRRPRAAPIGSQHVMALGDDAVLVTGLSDSTGVQDGKPFSNPGRVTFVIAKRGPEWKIVHLSPVGNAAVKARAGQPRFSASGFFGFCCPTYPRHFVTPFPGGVTAELRASYRSAGPDLPRSNGGEVRLASMAASALVADSAATAMNPPDRGALGKGAG